MRERDLAPRSFPARFAEDDVNDKTNNYYAFDGQSSSKNVEFSLAQLNVYICHRAIREHVILQPAAAIVPPSQRIQPT